MEYLESREFATSGEFIAALNKHRLAHKGKWLAFAGTVAGKRVEVKTFGHSYLQILNVDGIRHGGAMDLNVGGWKAVIEGAL